MEQKQRMDDAEALYAGNSLADILVRRGGRTLPMLGEGGAARELSFLPSPEELPGTAKTQEVLPVLIGSGTGAALEDLSERLETAFGPHFLLAVVDRERDILAANGALERFSGKKSILWLDGDPPHATLDDTLRALTRWQADNGGKPFLSLLNPFYLRLDREYYTAVKKACEASSKANFWDRARYAKFREDLPRILMLTSKYFLMGEIVAACERLGVPHRLLQLPKGELGRNEFIEHLLAEVIEFKPDFVFTINHLGVDREGVLAGLLENLRLPLASWFVDNPHLVLYLYSKVVNPWTAIFTWDVDNIHSLRASGFEHVSYLPLGTDVRRFLPPEHSLGRLSGLPAAWNGDVSFVGNSMVSKVSARMGKSPFPRSLIQDYHGVAAAFAATDDRSVRAYLKREHEELLRRFDALETDELKLGYETMITWEATRQYRFSCVESMLLFAPLIVGDSGWKELIDERQAAVGDPPPVWHHFPELNYYTDLPRFYPFSAINFNCTSKQMKGAVNQRVFDVPATGAFLLTDYRDQVENLFEPGSEIVCYRSPEEAADLARYYLAHPEARHAVAAAARRRILGEHSYEHRVRALMNRMREFFG